MKTMRAVHPKLYSLRANRISLPPRRSWNLPRMLCAKLPHHLFQNLTALKRPTLVRHRRSQLALAGSAVKVSVRVVTRKFRHGPVHSYLPSQTLPMKAERCPWISRKLQPFPATSVGIEAKSPLVHLLHQHHTHARRAIRGGGRQRSRIGVVWLTCLRFSQPLPKHGNGVSRCL